MRRRSNVRACFKKIDILDSKWTRGRACIKLPGRIIVTPTNFKTISYLNLEDYSYNYFYRHPEVGTVPRAIAEEYFHCKYLRCRNVIKFQEFSDLESRHFSETRNSVTYEYDLYMLQKLQVEWNNEKLKKYLEYYRTSKKIDFQRSSLVYTTFTAVLGKHCTDSALVVEFFKTLCSHVIACESIFMGSTPYLKLFLENALRIGFDPWALMKTFQVQKSSPVMEFCPVEWSLIQGKLEHLELLLRFGCPFHVSNYSTKMFNKKIDGRWWNRNRSPPIVMPGNRYASFSSPHPSSPTDFRQSPTFLAHFTVVLNLTASNAVIYGGGEEARRFADSIRIFMRSVPESYVSHEDMLAIVGQLAPSIAGIVEMSCVWYRNMFPDESSEYGRGPRSLMHLSRCAIRNSCLLPHGITKLPLPQYLKSYLNLEW